MIRRQRWFGITVELGTYLVLLAAMLWVVWWCLRWVLRGLAVLLPLVWLGCVTPDSQFVNAWVRDLNERGVTSCLWYQGSAGPYFGLRGITATGGATLEECLRDR